MDRIWKYALVIFTIILVDQFSKGLIQHNFSLGESKPIIEGLFNITYVRNPGAAFGMGAGASDGWRKFLFLFIPVLACIWLCILIWQSRKGPALLGWAYSLILAGAVGNLWDRFTLRYVVDFLDFYWGANHFPAFNIADSCISIAAGLIIYDLIMQKLKERKVDTSSV
jgi:signal peptidase II